MVELLVSLGTELNTAKTMICLHENGPTTSSNLQKCCELRQPDVSIAINQLTKYDLIDVVTASNGGRGRPSHTYELSVPLDEALKPFREQAVVRLSKIQTELNRLAELTDSKKK
tara:strand:+ start:406 stop:747 length:342 start_codon:yes stop_codon:yes gene_type:complete